MSRIFFLMAAVTVLMILTAGGGVYWLTITAAAQARQDAIAAAANGIASGLSGRIDVLNKTLDKMAQDPDVVSAAASKNPALLSDAAIRLERHFPEALKIRLLLPGVSDLDDKNSPRMSLGDLGMVRETFSAAQLPAIQGDTGAHRHLAMTRRIMSGSQAVGVILASLNYDFIRPALQAGAASDRYIELRQEKLVLGAAGIPPENKEIGIAQLKVANTGWELRYGYTGGGSLSDIGLIAGVVGLSLLIAALAFYFGYRKLAAILAHDMSSLVKAVKDMMKNRLLGNYPIYLTQINTVISTLSQFKRVVENEGEKVINGNANDLGQDDFFFASEETGINKQFIEKDSLELPVTGAVAIVKKPNRNENAMSRLLALSEPANKADDRAAIFRAYDIRGIVGATLTSQVVYDVGRALGTDAKEHGCKTIVVGRDGRDSSLALSDALAEGIITTGCDVLNIGMVPTPTLYFIAHHIEGRCGVMITGSHNPAEYNGLKMVIKGETLAGERIQKLRQCIDSQDFAKDQPGSIERTSRYTNDYIGTVSDDIHIARPMKVVLDCGNGVAGELGPVLLRTIGCEVIELFCDVDGTFPNHHPDPSKPENLTELILAVDHYKADLGIAFDGDGDRLGVVDSSGKIIWPDRQMMLFAKDVLTAKPGAEIIFDVKCSRHLASQISKYGGRPVMWKTGHSLMKAKLKETGAKLAGEMSGHIFFNDRWFGFDDALYSAARLIEILSTDTRSSAEVFAGFPDSINTPELNVGMAEGENFKFIETLISAANFANGKIIDIDGMRVEFPNGWGLVRASNTTPSLVIRFEADSKQAMLEIQEQFRQLMKKVKPDIALPF